MLQTARDLIQRHSSYYLDCIAKRGKYLFGETSPTVLVELKPELDNIHLAWQQAAANQWWDLLEIGVEGMSNYYFLTGYLPEFASLLNEILSLPETAVPPQLHGDLLEKLAISSYAPRSL